MPAAPHAHKCTLSACSQLHDGRRAALQLTEVYSRVLHAFVALQCHGLPPAPRLISIHRLPSYFSGFSPSFALSMFHHSTLPSA